jgi:hypothetical protein
MSIYIVAVADVDGGSDGGGDCNDHDDGDGDDYDDDAPAVPLLAFE